MKQINPTVMTASGLGGAVHPEDAPDLLIILSSCEPQTQLMSMVLTLEAIKQGSNAHILLCGPAGDLALKDAPPSATAPQKPRGMSPQELMLKIMESGASVEVCAIYLPNKELEADALLEGITVAKPSEVAARMLKANTRTVSF